MHLRNSSFQLILYVCVYQLKDHMVLYSGYTEPDYKTMVFYSAPLLCLREGHFSNRSPGLMLRKKPVPTLVQTKKQHLPHPYRRIVHYGGDIQRNPAFLYIPDGV